MIVNINLLCSFERRNSDINANAEIIGIIFQLPKFFTDETTNVDGYSISWKLKAFKYAIAEPFLNGCKDVCFWVDLVGFIRPDISLILIIFIKFWKEIRNLSFLHLQFRL